MFIVNVVFLFGSVFVFNLLNKIKLCLFVCFKILIIFVIWDEKVDNDCFIDCLFLIL